MLRIFSERLAVELYLNRSVRGSERATRSEVECLAKLWGINIESWQLTGRSLLNRDAKGNYKFAHRSIMEYLYVFCCLAGERRCARIAWTDQMQTFFLDFLRLLALDLVAPSNTEDKLSIDLMGAGARLAIRRGLVKVSPFFEEGTREYSNVSFLGRAAVLAIVFSSFFRRRILLGIKKGSDRATILIEEGGRHRLIARRDSIKIEVQELLSFRWADYEIQLALSAHHLSQRASEKKISDAKIEKMNALAGKLGLEGGYLKREISIGEYLDDEVDQYGMAQFLVDGSKTLR